MNKLRTILLFAILPLLLTNSLARAQTPNEPADTKAIFLAHYTAIEAGDIDTAMTYLVEDYISIVLPPPPGTDAVSIGAETNRSGIEYLISDHIDYEFINIDVQGDTLTFRALVFTDLFRSVDVNPIEFRGTAVVQDGMIVSETWIMDKDDNARLRAAFAQENNKAILLRAYEEVFNKGNFDILDQDIAPNAIDHSSPDLQGVDAFKIPMTGLRTAFPDLQVTAEMIVADGDLVMALATFTGTHEGEFLGIPPSGKQVTWSHVDINRIENGKVVEAWHIGTEAMLLALGFELVPPSE